MTPTAFPRYILAPYLATPDDVVERMLDLAAVGAADVVYDLGCGDGRIAIAAARRGARSVAIDYEPYWVEQARANVAVAGMEVSVRIELGDALELDLAPATVVCVYLVHWSTQKLAQHLRERCAPGTRVVSHSFPFEHCEGTRSIRFSDADGQPRQLHLWVLPPMAAS